jgi:pyruvate kinase
MRKTKIVCTLGPATDSDEGVRGLIEAGANVIRLNFSHGDQEGHGRSIARIRRIATSLGRPIAILQDLQGPKIRLGKVPGGTMMLEPNREIILTAGETTVAGALPVTYRWLSEDVSPGEHILLADGMVELEAMEIIDGRVHCRVIVGGPISSRKGVNLPRSELRIPSFTDKDREDLLFGLSQGIDVVALSFVRHENDIEPIRKILESHAGPQPLIVAKIEKPQAVERLDRILEHVDAIMVARGDLGVEMPIEEVPMIQKKIIEAARNAAKPVITATQMLRSMVDSPRPTRAEASDVANAVLDGTDAVMLSEESAVGNYPVEAVEILDRVTQRAEASIDPLKHLKDSTPEFIQGVSAAIARAACILATEVNAVAIVATTTSGSTARLLARYLPGPPIVGLTTSEMVMRQLSLSRGVIPAMTQTFADTDDVIDQARRWCLDNDLAAPGDPIVVTAGLPISEAGTTNLVHAASV